MMDYKIVHVLVDEHGHPCQDGDPRVLVVRTTPQGVATVECDCPSERAARSIAGPLRAAELARIVRYGTVTDQENERELERMRWIGQGKLF